ncbi:replication-relaxation family protein [Streptomyces sp. NPDC094153]|uniref:replication-relaxation family protein n=1 Tax=Streptomyces sp. NPDC094153 TaxID=3366058 RepID=UPI003823BA8D
MGGSKTYPYGSTTAVRGHVLAALGVLKIASPDQIRRLMCPGHKDNKAVRNACLDLARHGLTVSEGQARDGNKLWSLTPLGLDAAAEVLERPTDRMGGTARGAARSGAPHAMAVNETVVAFTRTPPAPTRPVPRQATGTTAPAAAPGAAGLDGDGIGTVRSWCTEVVLSLPSSGRNRTGARADGVLQAPEAGLPVLMVEVDNCTETADVLAAKFDRYRRFFRLKIKDHKGHDIPVWRTLYPSTGREGYPPVAVIFNPGTRLGAAGLKNRMNQVMELTRVIWSGSYEGMHPFGQARQDGYYDYTDAIPVLFTTLERLKVDGPRGAVWWRCGHGQWEDLPTALANPNDVDAWHARDEERRLRREEQRHREREEARPTAAWGQQVPGPARAGDERLGPVQPTDPPTLCERCGQPVTGPPGEYYGDAVPPEDGRHCPTCRTDLAQQPPGLLKALFGRRT